MKVRVIAVENHAMQVDIHIYVFFFARSFVLQDHLLAGLGGVLHRSVLQSSDDRVALGAATGGLHTLPGGRTVNIVEARLVLVSEGRGVVSSGRMEACKRLVPRCCASASVCSLLHKLEYLKASRVQFRRSLDPRQ